MLLGSRNHPDGFRYELLITSFDVNEKSYELTASLNPSFFDSVGAYPSRQTRKNGGNDVKKCRRTRTNRPNKD